MLGRDRNQRSPSAAALAGERKRAILAGFFLLCGAVSILWRAGQLQLLRGTSLRKIAEEQYVKEVEITPKRGSIFDRNMEKLAMTVIYKSLYADPLMVRHPDAAASALARALLLDEDALRLRLRGKKRFVWIKRFLADEEVERIKAIRVAERSLADQGIRFVEEGKRLYPRGRLAAQLLGVLGGAGRGLEGLEMDYDALLRGSAHSREGLRDALGELAYMGSYIGQVDDSGGSIRLTIDSRIQHAVEEELAAAVVRTKAAKGGMAVVLDPASGEILAMASEPSLDLNAPRSKADQERLVNRVVNQLYEPGSALKPATFAAALIERKITPSTIIDCNPETLNTGGPRINDLKDYERLSVLEVLKQSVNVGTARIGLDLGWPLLRRHLAQFGFGEFTGVGLHGERAGRVAALKGMVPRDVASVSFGYGLNVNLLRMATFYAAIANRGIMMKPFVVKALYKPNGEVVETGRVALRRTMPVEVASTLSSMLESVVMSGTGTAAALKGYRAAGKTGTARKIDGVTKTYSRDDLIVSFAGFVPVEKPAAVIAVLLDEPASTETGGSAAAPLFARIAEAAMRIMGAEQSALVELPKPSGIEDGGAFGGWNFDLPAEVHLAADSMPQLIGMPARRLLEKATTLGLDVDMEGVGVVAQQQPQAGGSISSSRVLQATLRHIEP